MMILAHEYSLDMIKAVSIVFITWLYLPKEKHVLHDIVFLIK